MYVIHLKLHKNNMYGPGDINKCVYITDFDERCSKEDHWDVDMSVYYDPGEFMLMVVFGEGFWIGKKFRELLVAW